MKILIAEDDDILFKVLQEKFEDKKFEVMVAKDGAQVIPLAEKFMPDVIVLDVLLPKMGGVEVLSYLKSNKQLSAIPVVALSNVDEDKIIKQVLILGAVDYMIKTQYPINEVVEKVNQYIQK